MKALLHTLLCTLVVLAAGWATQSCTHNGGDVSPWWGTWHVESVEAQGKPVTTIAGDFFFQFQGEVVRLSWRNDRYDSAESYGNWSEGQGTITMRFVNPDAQPIALPGLGATTTFTIEHKSHQRIVLSTVAQGASYRYTLKKVV